MEFASAAADEEEVLDFSEVDKNDYMQTEDFTLLPVELVEFNILEVVRTLHCGPVKYFGERPDDDDEGPGEFRMGVCQLVDEDGNPPSKEVMDYLILREFEFCSSQFIPADFHRSEFGEKYGYEFKREMEKK